MSGLDPVSQSNDLSGSAGSNGSGGALATIESQLQPVPALGWSYGPPQRPEILSAKANPLELMHAVRRRWPIALGAGLGVGTVIAALVWFLVPIKYEAFALLRVAEKAGQVLGKTGDADAIYSIYKRTQMQLIMSGPVLRNTVRDPKVARLSIIKENNDDPVAWLKNHIIMDYPDDSEILRVAVTGTKRSELTTIVDTIVDKYLTEVVARERDQRLQTQAQLEKKYNDILADYQRESQALHDLEKVYKTSSTDAAQMAKKLAEDGFYEAAVARNNIQKLIAETDIAIMALEAKEKDPKTSQPPEALIEKELRQDPVVIEMNRKIADYETALATHTASAADKNKSRPVQYIQRMIAQLEEKKDQYKEEQREHVVEVLTANEMLDRNSRHGAMSLQALQAQKEQLNDLLEKAKAEVLERAKAFENLQSFSSQVSTKQQELSLLQQLMTEVRAQLNHTQIERLAQDRISKVDDATLVSSSGDALRKYLGVVFAGMIGFGLVVVGVGFVEFQARRLNKSQQVHDGLGIKVIGELPGVASRTWRRMKGGKGPAQLKALMAERIDGTRTALIHTSIVDSPRVVMVTSAEPHEGKTTTASQLAASLARSGRRTLLIDADIRNPGVHHVFDMPLEPGLSELLRGEAERESVVHPTRTSNLWLLPAGRCDLRSVQALSTSFLGTAVAALCVQFDYVVIDSGPVLKVADSLLIGQHVDVAVVSVRRDVSRVPSVYEACERLRSVGITVLGAVVNGVNDDVTQHGTELLSIDV